MPLTTQPDNPQPSDARDSSVERRQARRQAVYAALLYLTLLGLFLFCAYRRFIPVVYAIVLSVILAGAIFSQLRELYRSNSAPSDVPRASSHPQADSREQLEVWTLFAGIPVIVTKRNFPIFVVTILFLWLVIWLVGTWWLHQIQ